MKAKHVRLIRDAIREALETGRLHGQRHEMTFATIDLMTGLADGPAIFSFPVDSYGFIREGRYRIDLADIGYRLTPL